MRIKIEDLRQKISAALQVGFVEDEIKSAVDYLMWAEMSGVKTQGIVKLTGKTSYQNKQPQHDMQVERETKLSQLINGGDHLSPYASQRAVEVAVSKAKEHGFGIVGVHNCQSSNGAQAYWAEKISSQDLIAIVTVRSTASGAAFGGIDPVFGTDPIAFSFPTTTQPLTFDMTTTAMTFFGLVLANNKGESIPENTAIDKDGKPTTDPAAAMNGALLSFDRSYKGSGLGMVVETLAGPLVGAGFGGAEGEWGNLFIAIDPNLLVDTDKFKSDVTELIKKIKSVRRQDSVSEIRLPGERAKKDFKQCVDSGFVEIDDQVAREIGWL